MLASRPARERDRWWPPCPPARPAAGHAGPAGRDPREPIGPLIPEGPVSGVSARPTSEREVRVTETAAESLGTHPLAEPTGEHPIEQLPVSRLLILGLGPGALGALVYVALSGPVLDAGFPPAAGLLIAIAMVIIPVELAVVVRAGRRESRGGRLLAAIPYRVPMSRRDWALIAPGLLVVSIVGFGLIGGLEAPLRDGVFGWLPAWFRDPLPVDQVGAFPSWAWMITLAAYFVLNVVAGPIVEELYFRGYLLPRMSRFGRWAPLLNTVLFSLYHFWSPWQFLSRLAGVAPFAYGVWWKRNVFLGMVVHIALNAIGTLTLTVLVLQAVD